MCAKAGSGQRTPDGSLTPIHHGWRAETPARRPAHSADRGCAKAGRVVDCGCTRDLAMASHESEGEVEHPFAFMFALGLERRSVVPLLEESPGIKRLFEQWSEGEACIDRKRGLTARERGTWRESRHLGQVAQHKCLGK